MVKSWCIWCETGDKQNNSGYFWIHQKCALKLMDISSDIESIKEMLKGIHPRNKKDKDKISVIYNFIKDIEKFQKQWDGTINILNKLKEVRNSSHD